METCLTQYHSVMSVVLDANFCGQEFSDSPKQVRKRGALLSKAFSALTLLVWSFDL